MIQIQFWPILIGFLFSSILVVIQDFRDRVIHGLLVFLPAIIGTLFTYALLATLGPIFILLPLIFVIFVFATYIIVFRFLFFTQLRGIGGGDFAALIVYAFWPSAFFYSILLSLVFVLLYLIRTNRLNASVFRGGLNIPYAGFLALGFIVWAILNLVF